MRTSIHDDQTLSASIVCGFTSQAASPKKGVKRYAGGASARRAAWNTLYSPASNTNAKNALLRLKAS